MAIPVVESSQYLPKRKELNMTEQPEWITTREAADIMDVELSTVSRLCREKKLKCRQFGEGRRSIWEVDKASAEAYQKTVGGRGKEIDYSNPDEM
jgi:excisionase family DNA binding protein